jgi:hypothetical protein
MLKTLKIVNPRGKVRFGPPGAAKPLLRLPLLAVIILLALAGSCSVPPAAPPAFEAQAYRPISFDDLLTSTGLTPGDKVVVPAYFWEQLSYDPLMVRQYVNLAGHPRPWRQVRWYAFYGSPQMHGYFNRVVMNPDQIKAPGYKRLDHLRLYGEVASLGGRAVYLRVQRLEKIEED